MTIETTSLRTWEQGSNKLWSSRPMTREEVKKHSLFQKWAKRELTYKEVLTQLNWVPL